MNSLRPDKSDILAQAGGFDPVWYARQFPDVGQQNLPEQSHFLTVGYRLGRGLSATQPTLAQVPGLAGALGRRPEISYCIPVMDRLSDLQATLGDNLEANRAQQDAIEFIVISYDATDETADWVRETFPEELRQGYLRLIHAEPLPVWHFGQAKNGFTDALAGRIYSSLDADNFVTTAETAQLLEALDRYPGGFVFHHFTGQWGDGSSGRVSLPASVYREVGYDPAFLPRQFDEVDLMLSAVLRNPGLPLLRYDGARDVLGSDGIRDFLRTTPHAPRTVTMPEPERIAPLNPHGPDYVKTSPVLSGMQAYNQALCFVRNAPDRKAREDYTAILRDRARALIEILPAESLSRMLFGVDLPDPPTHASVCCLTRPDAALPEAAPDRPVYAIDARPRGGTAVSPAPGLTVLHPCAGHILTSGPLWTEGLIRALAAGGCVAEAMT